MAKLTPRFEIFSSGPMGLRIGYTEWGRRRAHGDGVHGLTRNSRD
jgi:hypothetical protein